MADKFKEEYFSMPTHVSFVTHFADSVIGFGLISFDLYVIIIGGAIACC